MIDVKIRSFFAARMPYELWSQLASGKSLVVQVEPDTSIGELLQKLPWLGLSGSFDDMIVVFVNGQQQALDYVLQADDVIDLHIPASGG